MPDQLRLFAPSEEPGPVGPAPLDPALASIATHLPSGIRLGTSSWAFPGWKGIVYDRDASQKTLSHHGLESYSRNPLFRAVAIDRTYYGPIPAPEFRAYAEQVPESFRFLVKAGATFPALVVRWMLRRDRDYEEAGEDFRPFNRLAAEDSSSRQEIARLCRETTKPAFVIVNNKAEGSAPLSVFKLAEEISRSSYQAIP